MVAIVFHNEGNKQRLLLRVHHSLGSIVVLVLVVLLKVEERKRMVAMEF